MADTRPNKLTPEDKELIRRLYLQGEPAYKIAARLNVAPNTINRVIHLENLQRPVSEPAQER